MGAFRIFDRRNCGHIGPNDLREVWDKEVSKAKCKELIFEVGGEDMHINFQEFFEMMKSAVNQVQAEIALETAFQTVDETHEETHEEPLTEGEDGQDVPFLEEEQSVKKKKTDKKKLNAAKSQSKSKDESKEKKKR